MGYAPGGGRHEKSALPGPPPRSALRLVGEVTQRYRCMTLPNCCLLFSKQKSHSQERLHNIVTPNKRDSIRSKVFAGGEVGFPGGGGAFLSKAPPPNLVFTSNSPGDQQRAVDEIQLAHKVPVLVEIKRLHGLMDKTAGPPVQGERQPENTGRGRPQAQSSPRNPNGGHKAKTSSALALPRIFASVRFPAARSVSISGRL